MPTMEEVLAQSNREASEAARKEAAENSQWLPPPDAYAFDFIPYSEEQAVYFDTCKLKDGTKLPLMKFRIRFASGGDGILGAETFHTVRWTNTRGLQEIREKIAAHLGGGIEDSDQWIMAGALKLVEDKTRWNSQVSKTDKGTFFNIRDKIAS